MSLFYGYLSCLCAHSSDNMFPKFSAIDDSIRTQVSNGPHWNFIIYLWKKLFQMTAIFSIAALFS